MGNCFEDRLMVFLYIFRGLALPARDSKKTQTNNLYMIFLYMCHFMYFIIRLTVR